MTASDHRGDRPPLPPPLPPTIDETTGDVEDAEAVSEKSPYCFRVGLVISCGLLAVVSTVLINLVYRELSEKEEMSRVAVPGSSGTAPRSEAVPSPTRSPDAKHNDPASEGATAVHHGNLEANMASELQQATDHSDEIEHVEDGSDPAPWRDAYANVASLLTQPFYTDGTYTDPIPRKEWPAAIQRIDSCDHPVVRSVGIRAMANVLWANVRGKALAQLGSIARLDVEDVQEMIAEFVLVDVTEGTREAVVHFLEDDAWEVALGAAYNAAVGEFGTWYMNAQRELWAELHREGIPRDLSAHANTTEPTLDFEIVYHKKSSGSYNYRLFVRNDSGVAIENCTLVVTVTDYFGKSDRNYYFIREFSNGDRIQLRTGIHWGIPGLGRTILGSCEAFAWNAHPIQEEIQFGEHGITAARTHLEKLEEHFYRGDVANARKMADQYVNALPESAPLYSEFRAYLDTEALLKESRAKLLKECEALTRFEGTLVAKSFRGILIQERTVDLGLKIHQCRKSNSRVLVVAHLYDADLPEQRPKILRGEVAQRNGVHYLKLKAQRDTGDSEARRTPFHPKDETEYEFTLRHIGLVGVDNVGRLESVYKLRLIQNARETQGSAERVVVNGKQYVRVAGEVTDDSAEYFRLEVARSGDMNILVDLSGAGTHGLTIDVRRPNEKVFEPLFLETRGEWPTYMFSAIRGVYHLRIGWSGDNSVKYRCALKLLSNTRPLPEPFESSPAVGDVFTGAWMNGVHRIPITLAVSRRNGRSFAGKVVEPTREFAIRGKVTYGKLEYVTSRITSGKAGSTGTIYRGEFDGRQITGVWTSTNGNSDSFHLLKSNM